MAGIDDYRSALRSITRGYWSGAIDLGQFYDEMQTAINRRLTQAWDEGAAQCGIKPDEYTVEEQLALGNAIHEQLGYVSGFALDISLDNRDNGGALEPLLTRIDNLWVNRYLDFSNRAKLLACQDEKLEWFLGATEKHCRTCPRLAGKVKRASVWRKAGLQPQNPPNSRLECGGWG